MFWLSLILEGLRVRCVAMLFMEVVDKWFEGTKRAAYEFPFN